MEKLKLQKDCAVCGKAWLWGLKEDDKANWRERSASPVGPTSYSRELKNNHQPPSDDEWTCPWCEAQIAEDLDEWEREKLGLARLVEEAKKEEREKVAQELIGIIRKLL